MTETLKNIIIESWNVFGLMSPYLLFGFFVAGVLSIFVSPDLVKKHLGGKGVFQILKASIFGVPLPLCSCSVIPVSASLRKSGASKASTISFLLSTPQTGVDSIAITYGLLGPVYAIFRPIIALITGFIAGLLSIFFDKDDEETTPEIEHKHSHEYEHCNDNHEHHGKNCCSASGKHCCPFLQIMKYGFITLPRDIGGALIIGVIITGLISALIPEDYMKNYLYNDFTSILVMMIISIPVYVCATASVPIAVGFIYAGFSPGAALAFLIAGPATNAATVTTIWKVLGKRTTIIYLATAAVSAVVFGLLLNSIMADGYTLPVSAMHEHKESAKIFYDISAFIMLAVLAVSYFAGKTETVEYEHDKNDTVVKIEGMTCSHCAESVKNALENISGVEKAVIDLNVKKAILTGKVADKSEIERVISELGYKVENIDE